MVLKQSVIAKALCGEDRFDKDRLFIVPSPEIEELRQSGAASVDLRLGRWFLQLRQTRHHVLDVSEEGLQPGETNLTRRFFVRFGDKFFLHPRNFVLGATLEWIKIPSCCTGTIVGKSSWGRRGLIIETAPTVHPGFSGCLTLELTNVGEMPIALVPGMAVSQLMLYEASGEGIGVSGFDGLRRPALGSIKLDHFAEKLSSFKY